MHIKKEIILLITLIFIISSCASNFAPLTVPILDSAKRGNIRTLGYGGTGTKRTAARVPYIQTDSVSTDLGGISKIQCYLSEEVRVQAAAPDRRDAFSRGYVEVYNRNGNSTILFKQNTRGRILGYKVFVDQSGYEKITLLVSFGGSNGEVLQFTAPVSRHSRFVLSGVGVDVEQPDSAGILLYRTSSGAYSSINAQETGQRWRLGAELPYLFINYNQFNIITNPINRQNVMIAPGR